MRQFYRFFMIVTLLFTSIYAQAQGLKGSVKDSKTGQGIPGVSISVQGRTTGTASDGNGNYVLKLQAGSYTIKVSAVGYQVITENVQIDASGTSKNFSLVESISSLEEVVVTGTRSEGRTKIDTPVPVDVIPLSQVTNNVGQVDINQILTFVAPSFQSSRQAISDGTDHVDPAQLRGLGPDQVLVLVNGKRRHQSSLVNVNGTVNRGTVGTDMNAIPATAVDKIEILRDGAAAQYGSDAIAGVINFRLKDAAEGGSFEVKTGQFYEGDGDLRQISGNIGLPFTDNGFANISGEFKQADPTSRSVQRSDAAASTAAASEPSASASSESSGAADTAGGCGASCACH